MKNPSRYMLLVVFLALLTPSSVFSQNQVRPLCDGTPGTCFQDLADVDPTLLQFGSPDPDGDFIFLQMAGSLDDHVQFRADGRTFVHITDTEAAIFFCPATAPTCLFGGSGMLVGSGRSQINSHFDFITQVPLCPTSISASGTVFSATGAVFDLTYVLVSVKDPSGGCRAVMNDVAVSPAGP